MDDRTIIAKDVLCAILTSDKEWLRYERRGNAEDAVACADALLFALAIKGSKDAPNPQTTTKGPMWRKMDDPPGHTGAVIVASKDIPNATFGATYRGGKWRWYDGGRCSRLFVTSSGDRWLDLNGFLPGEND